MFAKTYMKAPFRRTINVTILYTVQNGFDEILWCCLHKTLKWLKKEPLTKIILLTVRVNETLTGDFYEHLKLLPDIDDLFCISWFAW